MRWLLALVATLGLVFSTTEAGIFGNKKPKPNQTERVLELVQTLKNDSSTSKRADAAEELRGFDGAEFPEIVSALVEALLKDSSSSVRAQAAESLGRLKPTSAEAAQALDKAVDEDKSFMVRFKARTARLGYRAPQPQQPPSPEGPVQVKVPPPDEKGRLKPVAVPSPSSNQATKPLPPPEGGEEPEHVTAKPREVPNPDSKPGSQPSEQDSVPKLGIPKKPAASKSQDDLPFLVGPQR